MGTQVFWKRNYPLKRVGPALPWPGLLLRSGPSHSYAMPGLEAAYWPRLGLSRDRTGPLTQSVTMLANEVWCKGCKVSDIVIEREFNKNFIGFLGKLKNYLAIFKRYVKNEE
ncbi:hypothetical protein AMTR_s00029p00179360 [Amborella trichopoda]|uniref:Uncharacterized protein n=1 Tax=Amborella trichopoda TaxID=13333 RepID=W1PNG2_AMBTC|nr:hypothetical protein AMTR_s00029p00179360 [Amborella trichopoda]